MGKYSLGTTTMDNPVYQDPVDVHRKDAEIAASLPFKTGMLDSSNSDYSSLNATPASRKLLLAVLGTFILTAAATAAITYPLTRSAFDTSCDATPVTCPTVNPVTGTTTTTWNTMTKTSTIAPTTKTTTAPPSTTTTTRATTTTTTKATTTTTPYIATEGVRSTSVSTVFGDVKGHVVDMGGENYTDNILSFKGIPYAKPPGRWEMPVPPEPWNTTLVADNFGNTCDRGGNKTESCLFLNIYTPMDASRLYPVMFWIHGGAYQSGASNGYPGHELAARGVVVVTINYRLGIFGFASGAGGLLPGNYGLWDQRQAMLFVKQTIYAFGGDPARITIFGESAGGASVGLQLISPKSSGLFHQAILESGNELVMWAANTPIDEPDTYIRQVADQVGCGDGSSDSEMVACLKGVDAKNLTDATFTCPFCLGFAPVIDGDFVPRLPSDMLRDGDFNQVDIMLGTNHDECNIFLLGADPLLLFKGLSRSQFEGSLVGVINYFYYVVTGSTDNATTVHELYEAMDFMYSPWPDIYNESLLRDQLGQACTDIAFAAPTNQAARFHSNQVQVYLYVYDLRYSGIQPLPDWIGIYHSYELAYVFGHPQISNGTQSLKDDSDIQSLRCWTAEDIAWSEYIITLWTNYAITGNPTPEPVAPPNMEPEVWEPFNNATFSYFNLNNDVVANRMNYRVQQTAFIYEYLWWIARDEHFDDIHALPESDVVLDQEKFAHNSVVSISIPELLKKYIEHLNETHDQTPIPWDKILPNGTFGIRNKRSLEDTVHAEGIIHGPTKPPKTLPNPLGHGILQGLYDNLTYTQYVALRTALIPIKAKYASTIQTVKDFLDLLRTDYSNVLQILQDFLGRINFRAVIANGQAVAEFCDVSVVDYFNEHYPSVVALLQLMGILPLPILQ